MQSLILVEILANGSKRTHALSQLAVITTHAGSSYAVVEAKTGKVPAGLTLHREDNALKVLVDNEAIVQMDDFYREGLAAEFTTEITTEFAVTVSDDVLISGSTDEMMGLSSGDEAGGSFLTVAGSVGLAAVIGGGGYASFMDAKDNNDGSSTSISGRQTSSVDTSIVVFDLINGASSSHSGATFDADTAYTIYIVIDSTGESPSLVPKWSGAENLGSDDTIVLVGNGDPLVGKFSHAITGVNSNKVLDGSVSWATGANVQSYAAYLYQNGSIANQSNIQVDLWTGTVPDAMSKLAAFSWMNSLPNGISSSQGLA